MTAHIVWDWAADCSRRVILQRQRSCLENCCASDRQRVFECRRNATVWHGRWCRADSRRPGSPERCRARTGGRESQSWTRRAASQEASAAGRAQARYNHIAWCPSRQRSELTAGSALVRRWCRIAQRVTVVQATDNKGIVFAAFTEIYFAFVST